MQEESKGLELKPQSGLLIFDGVTKHNDTRGPLQMGSSRKVKYGNEQAPIFGEGRLFLPVPQLFLDSAWNAGFIHESAAPDGSLPVAFPHASGERRHSFHRQRYFVFVTAAMSSRFCECSALICKREYA